METVIILSPSPVLFLFYQDVHYCDVEGSGEGTDLSWAHQTLEVRFWSKYILISLRRVGFFLFYLFLVTEPETDFYS